jgi:hypothetical protein
MRKRKLPGVQRRQNNDEASGGRMRLLSMVVGALTLGAGLLAAGGSQAASASGYTTGTAQSVSGTQNLNAAACYTSAACVAVGDNGATSGEVVPISNGTPAASQTAGGAGTSFKDVACINQSTCDAVGSVTGATGTIETLALGSPSGSTPMLYPLNGIGCVGSSCVEVGQDPGTTQGVVYNGNWQHVSGSNHLNKVACTSALWCLAVGEQGGSNTPGVFSVISNGTAGTAQAIPGTGDLTGVACWGTTSCVAVGSDSGGSNGIVVPINNGVAGPVTTLTGDSLNGVSCPSAGYCIGTGFSGSPTATGFVVPISNGVPGTPQLVSGTTRLVEAGCASAASCVAVGNNDVSNVTTGAVVSLTKPQGYWLVGSDGGIFSFGAAVFHGSTGNLVLQRPVVGIAPTNDEGGYWLTASDGGVFAFGDSQFMGSLPGLGFHPAGSGVPNSLNKPVVGLVPSIDDGGYFMVASDGGVFAFGDARFAGSCPGLANGCNGAGVAVMPDASGQGYWLVTATGNVYSFGDATYFGGPGQQSSPIVSAVRTPDGHGYWILDANGQVFAYGDAASLGGPTGSVGGSNPASAIFADSSGNGYWVAAANGAVFQYGDATNNGGMSGTKLNGPIIAGTGF